MPTDPSGDDRANWWTRTYRDEAAVPWDTGRPQSRLVALSEAGRIEGRVLDVGCGLGTEARYLADRGHDVVGVDVAPPAVERARERAREHTRPGDLTFIVGDAFALSNADVGPVDTVVDVGVFHTLAPGTRPDYAASLATVLRPGGRVVLLEFGIDAPDDWGPTPVSERTLREGFDEGWAVETVEPAPFETRQGPVEGILGVFERAE